MHQRCTISSVAKRALLVALCRVAGPIGVGRYRTVFDLPFANLNVCLGHTSGGNGVTTASVSGREALRRVPLAPEPEHPDEMLNLDSAQTVIYWARPIDADNPRVVGIQIGAAGIATVFFAVVFSP